MNTDEIMKVALDLLNEKKVPIDTCIHLHGDNIKRIIFCLDVTAALLIWAKEQGFDAVVGHHPVGVMARAGEVFRHHKDVLEMHGIPRDVIERELGEHIEKFIKKQHHDRHRMLETESANRTSLETDIAKMINMPLMNIHNLFDEKGRRVLQEILDHEGAKNPNRTLGDVLDTISALPEAKYSTKFYDIPPEIVIGDPKAKAGKVAFIHGALHVPTSQIVKFCWAHGIETVVVIHMSWEDQETLKKEISPKNLISTGHCTGDSFGFTPFTNVLREKGIEVVCMGGVLDVEELDKETPVVY